MRVDLFATVTSIMAENDISRFSEGGTRIEALLRTPLDTGYHDGVTVKGMLERKQKKMTYRVRLTASISMMTSPCINIAYCCKI